MEGRKPLLVQQPQHPVQAAHGAPQKLHIREFLDSLMLNRSAVVVIAVSILGLMCLTSIGYASLARGKYLSFDLPHEEDSGEDLYQEDTSWIKDTERRFKEEERLRQRLKEQAKRKGGKPGNVLMEMPPSAFPVYKPRVKRVQPTQTEAQRLEEERLLEEEERLQKELEAAEYKYLLEGDVVPPRSRVPNCPSCEEVVTPRECGQIPRTISSDVERELDFLQQNEFDVMDDWGRRRLRFAVKRPHGSHQMPFQEPTDIRKDMMTKIITSWKAEAQCAFWTRQCVRMSQHEVTVLPFDQRPDELFPGHVMPFMGDQLFPRLNEGDLGTCAIVGSGANLLGKNRGSEIDQHSTVFRFLDTPLEGFESDVGKKTTVPIIKAGMSSNPEVLKAVRNTEGHKYYAFENPRDWRILAGDEDVQAFKFQGKLLLWPTKWDEEVARKLYTLYLSSHPAFSSHVRHVPTTGFNFVTALIASKLCLRVDIYGFSALGAGRYYSSNQPLSRSHVSGLEHWTYRTAMGAEMGVCVYD